MSDIDPNKLKVAELREELKARGLDIKGTKPVLVKRLREALDKEDGGAGEGGDELLETSQDVADELSQDDSQIQENLSMSEEPAKVEEPMEETASAEQEAEQAPEQVDEPEPEPEAAKIEDEKEKVEEKHNGEEEAPPAEELGEEYQTIDETSQDDGDGANQDEHGQKRKRSRSRSRERRRSRSRERSRRSRSRSRERHRRPPPEMDDDSWESGTNFKFDRFNCDLNMRVDENGVKAHPLTVEGFVFMWAGVRTMYGVNKGKVAFEVKILENLNVDHLPSEESNPHVVRVGFSVDSSSLQLGEEALSYGYGGTGKASTECKFNDYGEKFSEGDVITAYLDLDSEEPTISYAKNGVDLGKCFDIDKAQLGDIPLFPHILTKNTEFECNFGQREEPWFPLQEGYMFVESVPDEDRVRGALPPAQKADCEILMMVGLPGAGKTYWAQKHAQGHPELRYNVLGTNNIIDKMKVMGLPRKKNYAGRWDVLIDKATKCLNRMIEIAARKKRNYILDQTNVYASARRRKMQPFEGFQRKAIVIVPTDEDFKTRIAQREKEEGKEVPEKAVLEMKANFTLPETGSLFDNVEFPEQTKEEIDELVEKYNKEGKAALPPPDKRFRGDRFSGRGRFDNRDRRGGYDNRYGGGGRGGYRDFRRGGGSGYFDRRGGSGGGYRSGGGRYDDRDRRQGSGGRQNYDRNYNQNRSGGGGYNQGSYNKQGSWGGNQGSWGGNQSSWGNQGSWGSNQQGYSGWGGYSQSSSSGYNQWPQQQGNWNNQNYWGQGSNQNYSQNQQYGNWSNYNYK